MCVSQLVKNPPAMQETLLPFLSREDPLEKGEGIGYLLQYSWASLVALVVKNPPANTGDIRDTGSIPGSGRSPGEGHCNPLQYSCLENPMAGPTLSHSDKTGLK